VTGEREGREILSGGRLSLPRPLPIARAIGKRRGGKILAEEKGVSGFPGKEIETL